VKEALNLQGKLKNLEEEMNFLSNSLVEENHRSDSILAETV
jgi:hypothetical protein